MGIIKNIIGGISRVPNNIGFSQRAIRKAEKIRHGEKVVPPKYPTTEKLFEEAQHDEKIREKLSKKNERLIDNANRITIKTENPPPREGLHKHESSKPFANQEEQRWMYGYYEPPVEKMQKGKLNFREALEILRAQLEVSGEGIAASGSRGSRAEDAQKFLDAHPGANRVEKAKLDAVFKYFRPFVRQEKQFIVRRDDIEELMDVIEDRRELLEVKKTQFTENLTALNFSAEGKKIDATIETLRQSEHRAGSEEAQIEERLSAGMRAQEGEFKRLHERLYNLRQLEKEALAEKAKENASKSKETAQR